MLSCLRRSYCIESFPTASVNNGFNNPLWLRLLREQRNNNNVNANNVNSPSLGPPVSPLLRFSSSFTADKTLFTNSEEGAKGGGLLGGQNGAIRRQERGERTINPRRFFQGFAIFNDFEVRKSSTTVRPEVKKSWTTVRPEVTTLNYPSQQPQLSNGVTFANLLKRARLRTSEDTTITTPISFTDEGTCIDNLNALNFPIDSSFLVMF